jgi:hypothetical protein
VRYQAIRLRRRIFGPVLRNRVSDGNFQTVSGSTARAEKVLTLSKSLVERLLEAYASTASRGAIWTKVPSRGRLGRWRTQKLQILDTTAAGNYENAFDSG